MRDTTGIPGVAGQLGYVIGRHADGIALRVVLLDGGVIVCEPTDVELAGVDR